MMETWILQVTNHHKSISYGSIRLWASVGYAVMALAYSVLLKYLPVSSTFYFYALMAVPAILLAFTVPRTHHESAIKKRVRLRDMPFKQLASYWTISYALFAILKQIPSGWQAQYLTFLVTDYGYDYAAFAAFMCLTAFCEVPSLFFSRRIINRFGLIKPIIVGVCLSVIEVLLYAFGTGLPFLVAGQIIKGLSFGLLMACQMQYVYRLAPKGLEVTTQAALGSISSIVGIFAAMGGGYLLESLGVRPFYMLLGGMHTLAVLVFVGGIVLGRFVMKRPLPEEIS